MGDALRDAVKAIEPWLRAATETSAPGDESKLMLAARTIHGTDETVGISLADARRILAALDAPDEADALRAEVERLAQERDFHHTEAHRLTIQHETVSRDRDDHRTLLLGVREILGASEGETVVAAARRVVEECDQARAALAAIGSVLRATAPGEGAGREVPTAGERVIDVGPGFVMAVPCPACLHTRCGPTCGCDCAAARAKQEACDADV